MLTQHLAMEIHKEPVQVRDVHARLMENKLLLVIVLTNGKVLAYESMKEFKGSERFRFKLI